MTDASGLSVCVPTHTGRGGLVADLLDLLVVAAFNVPEPIEILVVDDAEGDEAERLERKCDEVGARYLRGPRSAGRKRNLAAEQASHDLLFFVDSDCLVTSQTLAAHLNALRQAPEDVAGVVGLTVMDGPVTKVWRTIENTQFHNPCFDFAERYEQVGWGTTANLSVRRRVFLEAAGFPADIFTLVGGEDVDFGLRVTDLGYRWITSREALVLHRRGPISRLGQVFERLFTYGRADVYLADRYPGRRDLHPNGYGLAAALAAVALLTRGRWRRAAAAAVVLVPMAALVREAWRRASSTATLYGERQRDGVQDTGGPGQIGRHLKASVIDSVFDIGIAWEAIRRAKPLRTFVRFRYVDDTTFRPRRRP